MKTNTTTQNASNEEITLGWNSLPAYGEVMTKLVGTSHTDVMSSMKVANKGVLNSFWSMLSSAK